MRQRKLIVEDYKPTGLITVSCSVWADIWDGRKVKMRVVLIDRMLSEVLQR
jgi:hypothetical protein